MRSLLLLLALTLCVVPLSGYAATFLTGKTFTVSEAPQENAYFAGTNVRVTAPMPADLVAAGGTLSVLGPVAGDVLLGGGTVEVRERIAGDLRAAGGHVLVEGEVAGDLLAAGGVVTITGTGGETRVAGGTVELMGGARGPTTVYGANVLLSGAFAGDVDVFASDHVTVAEGTVIQGALRYNAPQEAAIPASATVAGGVTYTGSSSFLPTVEEAQTFAIAGAGVVFVVGIISSIIAAGLVAGLFPAFAERVSNRALGKGTGRFFLLALLGFGVLVATPVFIMLLFVSVVGLGVALTLGALYLFLLSISYLYAAVLAGGALARSIFKRTTVSWKDAVLGMLVLQLIGVIPGLGPLVVFVLTTCALGAVVSLAYQFAFPKSDTELVA